jgi:hypothetical protein
MAITSHNIMSTVATHEHAYSVMPSTRLQLTGGDGVPG